MRINKDRVYKITWTAKAIGGPYAPTATALIDPAGTILKAFSADEPLNFLRASRITIEYDTDEETDGTVDFTFDVIAGAIDAPDRTKHDPYATLVTAIAKDKAKSVPVTPGPEWFRFNLTIATTNMTAAKSVYLYIRIIE